MQHGSQQEAVPGSLFSVLGGGLGVLPRIAAFFGAGEVPRVPTRPPAPNDTVTKSLKLKDKPRTAHHRHFDERLAATVFSTRFVREEKSHTATRSRLSAPRPSTPFLVLAILLLLEIMVPLEISPRVTIVSGPHRDRVLVEMTLQTVSFLLQRRRAPVSRSGRQAHTRSPFTHHLTTEN
jgi:hypothetical protein